MENVQVAHPVYNFLIHAETKGLLPHFSSSFLPLQRIEIIEALKTIRKSSELLSTTEKKELELFETEFEISERKNAVVIYSSTDSVQVLSSRFFSDNEKFIYRFNNNSTNVNIVPLGSIEGLYLKNKSGTNNVLFGNLGVRLHGTIANSLGYYLQATNGAILSGDKLLAKNEINKLRQNVKFSLLNSDFDFSESHVNFRKDWFFAGIGRETRLFGSGIQNRILFSDNAPPFDAIILAAKFSNFQYTFMHGSLISTVPVNSPDIGIGAIIPAKYITVHRFALKPEWGEIAFWETIIYSKRNVDLTYLNPLSFLKSMEHALHDRDNSVMGGDITLRPLNNFQIKGSFFLDDIKFDEIGKKYWSNKTAWNLGLSYVSPFNIDFGIEYARVEPYTFSHFDTLNSFTNDGFILGSRLLPNSDEISFVAQWWWGNRYPLTLKISCQRHGNNIYENGILTFNAGADPLQTRRSEDSWTANFLDGIRQNTFKVQLETGWEIVRGFNLQCVYQFRNTDTKPDHIIHLVFRYEDF